MNPFGSDQFGWRSVKRTNVFYKANTKCQNTDRRRLESTTLYTFRPETLLAGVMLAF